MSEEPEIRLLVWLSRTKSGAVVSTLVPTGSPFLCEFEPPLLPSHAVSYMDSAWVVWTPMKDCCGSPGVKHLSCSMYMYIYYVYVYVYVEREREGDHTVQTPKPFKH